MRGASAAALPDGASHPARWLQSLGLGERQRLADADRLTAFFLSVSSKTATVG